LIRRDDRLAQRGFEFVDLVHRFTRARHDRLLRSDFVHACRHDRDRFDRRGALGDADRDGIPNKFDRDSRFYDARATVRHPQWGDFDRDGVANQFDRAPRNPRRH
jgi:hypothetical protein